MIFNNRYSSLSNIHTRLSKISILLSLVAITLLLVYILGFPLKETFLNIQAGKGLSKLSYTSQSVNNSVNYKRIIEGSPIEPSIHNNGRSMPTNNIFSKIINIHLDKLNNKLEHSETLKAIYEYYNADVREFLISRQAQNWIEFKYLEYSQIIFVSLFVIVIISLTIKKIALAYLELFYFIFVAILIEIFINIILNPIDSFIISELVWMLPMPVFLYLSELKYFQNNA